MSEKILVPVLGESITEATVSKWLKNEGDNVEADEPIVELETDKVNLEVPSPISGILTKINSKDGSVVEVGISFRICNSENGSNVEKSEEIKKIEPKIQKDNVIKLENPKDEELKMFEKTEESELEEEPLVLTSEVKEENVKSKPKTDQTLIPSSEKDCGRK